MRWMVDASLRLVRADRRADARAQLAAAADLLHAAVGRDAADREFANRWLDTVAPLLHAYGANAIEDDVLTRGKDWRPASKAEAAARSAFAEGLANEIRAAVAGRLSGPRGVNAGGWHRIEVTLIGKRGVARRGYSR